MRKVTPARARRGTEMADLHLALNGEDLDAAIDAAIAAQQHKGDE